MAEPRSLTELVDAVETWTPMDWWRLEIRSLDAAPYVQSDLVVLAPPEAVKSEYTRVTAGGCIQGLSYLYLLVGPLIGAILMVRWALAGGGDGMPLTAAGVLTAIALAVTAYSEVQERRHPRAISARSAITIAALQVLPGVATALVALTTGRDQLGDGSGWWLPVIAVEVVVHIVIAVRSQILPTGRAGLLENLRAGVTELDTATLDSLVARRSEALARLRERGLIDDPAHERAQHAPIAELGLTMAPELARAGIAR